MARDERLFDLGLVVGVQVKTGERWFREPAYDDEGELLGWWFRDDDRDHIDSWLRHGLPHLIVLHNLDTGVSYWEHIRDDVVQPTGKGAKVLVPVHQTLDDAHRNALLEVAATLRPRVGWEGSAWTGAASLLPRDRLRQLFATEVGPVEGRYADALAKALPHLTADEVALRYRAMVGLLALHQTGTLQDLHPSGHADNATAEQLVTMLTGMFLAPSESDARAARQSMTPRT